MTTPQSGHSQGEGPTPGANLAPGRRYGRRWFRYALGATWRFFRANVAWSVVGLVGAAAGIFILTPAFLGSSRPDLVREEILLAVFAFTGSAILVLLGVFVWEFINAPAALEREAAALAATRRQALERDLASEQQGHADLRNRIDASRLRIELIDESGVIATVASSQEAKTRFIESEKQALLEPLTQEKPRRSIFDIDIYGESRSQQRYMHEVREYLTALNERWLPALTNAAVDRGIAELLLVAKNNAEVGVAGVEIQLSLPDDLDAAWDEGELWQEDLPDRPTMWGSYNAMTFIPDIIPSTSRRPPGHIERRGGRVVITWEPFALTSKRSQPLAPVRLFVPDTYSGQTINGAWSAASVPGGEPITGEVELSIATGPVAPDALLLPPERND
jgi:hypothetical protein